MSDVSFLSNHRYERKTAYGIGLDSEFETISLLSPPYRPDSELAGELIQFVKQRLAKHQTPQRIVFLDALPRNPSGKVLRYQLRADAGKQ